MSPRSQRSDPVLDLQSAWTAVFEWMKASLSWWVQHASTDATASVKKLNQANGKLSAQTVGMQSKATDFVNREIRNSKLRNHSDNSSTTAQLNKVFLRGRIVCTHYQHLSKGLGLNRDLKKQPVIYPRRSRRVHWKPFHSWWRPGGLSTRPPLFLWRNEQLHSLATMLLPSKCTKSVGWILQSQWHVLLLI